MDRSILQVQPQYNQGEAWAALAKEDDLCFEVIELSLLPALNESGLFEKCRDWYSRCGLVKSYHGNFIDVNPASGDMKVRQLSRDRSEESCAVAKELGAERVVFHSSCFPFLRGVYLDTWAGSCADFYSYLAEKYGLEICIENSMDLDPDPIAELMSRIDDKRVGVCLDIGHANYSNAPIEKWFNDLGERIYCMHLSDNNGDFDEHLVLGDGNVDWEKTDRLWRELGRSMPLTLEVGYTMDRIKRSVEYLRSNAFFGQSMN